MIAADVILGTGVRIFQPEQVNLLRLPDWRRHQDRCFCGDPEERLSRL